MRTIWIETQSQNYPFIVGEGSIEQLPKYIDKDVSTIMIVTDETVAQLHLASVTRLLDEHHIKNVPFILPIGEEAKSLLWLERLLTAAIEAGLDRSSMMIALGGGVVGDVTGFAAAIYMRGIPYIQLPTTVLAHDSSIGGKVAINHPLGKNLIGSFHHPQVVLYDTRYLLTLSERDYVAGFAEMIKHAIIRDESLFTWLEENVERLLLRDLHTLDEALYRSTLIKADIVKQDEKEANIRALLNYGHTIGQALENYYNYRWLHGEAISVGMIAAAQIAIEHFGYEIDLPRIKRLIKSFQLPTNLPAVVDGDSVLSAAKRDKKARGGQLVMVFPEKIGHAVIRYDVLPEWILKSIDHLVEE